MTTPSVTIQGKIKDISGAAVAGNVIFTLVNYGGEIPTVVDDGMLAPQSQVVKAAADGSFSITLFGNHQITPGNTFYTVSVCEDDSLAPINTVSYLFDTDGTFDLASLTPLSSDPSPITLMKPSFAEIRGNLMISQISATGTPSVSTFLRGDGSWSTPVADWSAITNKPTFAAVATSGSYTDLSNKPTIPDVSGFAAKGENTDITSLKLADGTAAAPSYAFSGATNTGMFRDVNGNLNMVTSGTARTIFDANGLYIPGTMRLAFSSDTTLWRDAANTLALRNAANAQTFRLYNTYTDASNYERLSLGWAANTITIGTEVAGTGTDRALALNSSNSVWLRHNGTSKLGVSGGNAWMYAHFLAGADNTYDIGASGANRPRAIFAGSSVTAPGVYAGSFYIYGSNGVYGFSSGSVYDAGISRTAAATLAVGNGTQGDASGTLKVGAVVVSDGTMTAPSYSFSGQTMGFYRSALNRLTYTNTTSKLVTLGQGVAVNGGGTFSWSSDPNDSTVAGDLFLYHDAANTLALRNGTNAQTFRIYNTYTDASNYERLNVGYNVADSAFRIETEKAGTGTARVLQLATNGTPRWVIGSTSGHLLAYTDNTYDIGSSGANRPRNIYAAGMIQGANVQGDTVVAWQTTGFQLQNNAAGIRWFTSGSADAGIYRTAAATLAIGNGTANDASGTLVGGAFKAVYGGNTTSYGTQVSISKNTAVAWSSNADGSVGGSYDLLLYREAAGVLAVRNGVNAQALKLYNTYTDASNYERLSIHAGLDGSVQTFFIETQKSGTGSARNLVLNTVGAGASIAFRTNGATRFYATDSGMQFYNGHVTFPQDNTYDIGATGANRPRSIYVGSNITADGDVTLGKGWAISRTTTADAPDKVRLVKMQNRAMIDCISALSGEGDYFYLANMKPEYTITQTSGTSIPNLFDNNQASGDAISTLAPWTLEITWTNSRLATDVLQLLIIPHRLSTSFNFHDWVVETQDYDTGVWDTVLARTGANDSGILAVPLHIQGTYSGNWRYIKGVRITVNSSDAASFLTNQFQINGIMLTDSRPSFTAARALGALDQAGGTVYGAVNLATYTGNVGVGTSSPAYKLDVNGTLNASSYKVAGGALDFHDLAGTATLSQIAATGTKDGTTFLRGDGVWAVPAGGSGVSQVNSDWNATSGVAQILNKPTLATVATSGSYNDLSNKPSIPAAQVQTDWNAVAGMGVLLNKPTLATVATSGSYTDLSNKPTIPAAQVNSDWNAGSGVAQILNKPTLPANTTATATQFITAYNSTTGAFTKAQPAWTDISGKPTFATVATSGSYTDLSNKPTIISLSAANTWTGTNAFQNYVTVQKDGTGTWAGDDGVGQLIIKGASNTNKRLALMMDTTNNRGVIQAALSGTGAYPLHLNPAGGDVSLGKAAYVDNSGSVLKIMDAGTGTQYVAISADHGSIELGPLTGTDKVPFIDFHFHGTGTAQDNQDYNVRLQNDADQQLSLYGNLRVSSGSVDAVSYKVNGGALDFHDLAGSATAAQLPARTSAISYVIDGGGSVPTAGTKGQITVPTACTIIGWYITADAAGTATVNVNSGSYANFPTVSTLCSPSLSAAQKNSATGLSYALAAGDQVQFAVSGTVTTCTRLNVTLIVSVPYA